MITITEIRSTARNNLCEKWGKAILICLCYFIVEFVLNLISGLVEKNQFIHGICELMILIISIPLSYGSIVSFIKLKRNEYVGAFDFLAIGFSDFSRAWSIAFRQLIKMILPIIAIIISIIIISSGIAMSISSSFYQTIGTHSNASSGMGLLIFGYILLFISSIYAFIKGLSLIYSIHIAYDNPSISATEACNRSQELMQGNKGTYFLLILSFIVCFVVAYIIFILCARMFISSFNITGLSLLIKLAYVVFGVLYLWQVPYMNVSTVCLYDFLTHKDDNDILDRDETNQIDYSEKY